MERQIGTAMTLGSILLSVALSLARAFKRKKKGLVVLLPPKCGKSYISQHYANTSMCLLDLDERISTDTELNRMQMIKSNQTKFFTGKRKLLGIVKELKDNAKPLTPILLTSCVELASELSKKYNVIKFLPSLELMSGQVANLNEDRRKEAMSSYYRILLHNCDNTITFNSFESLNLQLTSRFNLTQELF